MPCYVDCRLYIELKVPGAISIHLSLHLAASTATLCTAVNKAILGVLRSGMQKAPQESIAAATHAPPAAAEPVSQDLQGRNDHDKAGQLPMAGQAAGIGNRSAGASGGDRQKLERQA